MTNSPVMNLVQYVTRSSLKRTISTGTTVLVAEIAIGFSFQSGLKAVYFVFMDVYPHATRFDELHTMLTLYTVVVPKAKFGSRLMTFCFWDHPSTPSCSSRATVLW